MFNRLLNSLNEPPDILITRYQKAVQDLDDMQEMRPLGSIVSPAYSEWDDLKYQQRQTIKKLRHQLLGFMSAREVLALLPKRINETEGGDGL